MKQINWTQIAPFLLLIALIALAVPALSVKKDKTVEHKTSPAANTTTVINNNSSH